MRTMKKVLAGGVFNIVHPGHRHFLENAKRLGDYLVVVVAHDRTAGRTKRYPITSQQERMMNVEKMKIADRVVAGDGHDFLKVVRKERPDIIALGYDQKADEEKLKKLLADEHIHCEIVRIADRLEGYKTSEILKKKNKK